MPRNRELRAIAAGLIVLSFGLAAAAQTAAAAPKDQKREILWEKLAASIADTDKHFDGVLGVAVLDLTHGKTLLIHGDEVFPAGKFHQDRHPGGALPPGTTDAVRCERQGDQPMFIPSAKKTWSVIATSCSG